MTSAQLARRLGVSQPRVLAIEKAEATGSIKLESLERAARALDCRLVYSLVPLRSFETMVESRARGLAKNRLQASSHSMALKNQQVDQANEQALTRQLS